MKEVATFIRKEKLVEDFTEEPVVDIDASFDGTCQRRGYSSLNGVVFAISKDAGQCIDSRVMSKRCSRESVELNKLRYVNYIGDGDSKSYSEVGKADPRCAN